MNTRHRRMRDNAAMLASVMPCQSPYLTEFYDLTWPLFEWYQYYEP